MSRRGRPILGAIAGLFFGLFLAADLAQWSVRPLDNLSVLGLPALGAVLGIVLGLWAPLGRKRVQTAEPAAAPTAGQGDDSPVRKETDEN